jgi:RNA polymerase sigma factor (sigma-70 family)
MTETREGRRLMSGRPGCMNLAQEFTEMFERQRGEAFACAYGLLSRGKRAVWADAQDVVMQAALLGWKHLADYRGDGPLEAWFFRIVRNCARLRSHGVWLQWNPILDDKHPAMIEARTIETLRIEADSRAEMRKAVSRLPRILRQAVEMAFYENLTQDYAAQRLGISRSAFNARLFRGLRLLRASSSQLKPVGRRFGLLTVEGLAAARQREDLWRCCCACGGEALVTTKELYLNSRRSCGCDTRAYQAEWRARRRIERKRVV